MPILVLGNTRLASGMGSHTGLVDAEPASTATFAGAELLRRNVVATEVPDLRYWTAYDHYMIDREARTLRTAQINALLGRGWRALSRLMFG